MRPRVVYPTPVVAVRFLDRPNRYLARVEPLNGGDSFEAHVPNPGRMEELLVPRETDGYVVPATAAGRRTAWDLVTVRHLRSIVSIDSRIGNRLVGQALVSGTIPGWSQHGWQSEFPWEDGRIDFAVAPTRRATSVHALLEVKSSNLKVGRTALFPDAPTLRGRRHLDALRRAAARHIRCAVVFVIQRSDVRTFAPNSALDPEFANALEMARRAGVEALAFTTRVRPGAVEWGLPVPMLAGPDQHALN